MDHLPTEVLQHVADHLGNHSAGFVERCRLQRTSKELTQVKASLPTKQKPVGVKWHMVHGITPCGAVGRQITNASLSTALQQTRLEFTEHELRSFGLSEQLTTRDFVKVGETFFQPEQNVLTCTVDLKEIAMYSSLRYTKTWNVFDIERRRIVTIGADASQCLFGGIKFPEKKQLVPSARLYTPENRLVWCAPGTTVRLSLESFDDHAFDELVQIVRMPLAKTITPGKILAMTSAERHLAMAPEWETLAGRNHKQTIDLPAAFAKVARQLCLEPAIGDFCLIEPVSVIGVLS